MKAGWTVTTLGNAFKTVTGNTPPKGQAHFYGTDIPLVKPPELLDGEVCDASDGLTLGGAEVARVAPIGSVLVSCIGNLGKVGLAVRTLAFNQQINAIYPNPAIAVPRFTFYQALSPHFRAQLNALSGGTTVAIVNKSRFNSIEVPLPPLEEQHQIVAVLDEVFEGLALAGAHAEANLRDARELFQRSLDLAFIELSKVAPIRTIGQIADIRGGKRLPQGGELRAEDTGFPYISIKDFTDDGSVDPKTVRFLDAETQEQIKRYIIRSDDLYISIAGTIGKTGIVPPELDGSNLTENAARLVFEAGVSNEYVYLFSRTTDFQDQAGLNTRTAAQPKLALSRLSTITLPLAEPQMQVDLISRMTAIREIFVTLSATYSDKINRIEALRQSLLQKAFAGELT